jgi:hypothetical protein
MLRTLTPFPHVGSAAFLATPGDEPQTCRILRRHSGHSDQAATALIALTGRNYPGEVASGNRTVPMAELHETYAAALRAATKRSRSRKAA